MPIKGAGSTSGRVYVVPGADVEPATGRFDRVADRLVGWYASPRPDR
jgi:hypothetical protein